jgi:hypothetical protein
MNPFDVTIIYDVTIRPPGPKMVVAVCPELGWFYRINTKPWTPAVKLSRELHPWLRHDSFLECGDPLELDDYTILESLRHHGIVGRVDRSLAQPVVEIVRQMRTLSAADKDRIEASLGSM